MEGLGVAARGRSVGMQPNRVERTTGPWLLPRMTTRFSECADAAHAWPSQLRFRSDLAVVHAPLDSLSARSAKARRPNTSMATNDRMTRRRRCDGLAFREWLRRYQKYMPAVQHTMAPSAAIACNTLAKVLSIAWRRLTSKVTGGRLGAKPRVGRPVHCNVRHRPRSRHAPPPKVT